MQEQVEQAAHGDREAMAEIVAEHYAAVYRFCVRRIGSELAKDAAQETFLTAQRTLNRFDRRSALLTFLLGIAFNNCRNLARKHRMQISYDNVWNEGDGKDFENSLVDRHVLCAALASLTREHREAVVLHEVEGLSYDEIGTLLGVPPGTVKSRLHHAFLALRKKLLPCEGVTA